MPPHCPWFLSFDSSITSRARQDKNIPFITPRQSQGIIDIGNVQGALKFSCRRIKRKGTEKKGLKLYQGILIRLWFQESRHFAGYLPQSSEIIDNFRIFRKGARRINGLQNGMRGLGSQEGIVVLPENGFRCGVFQIPNAIDQFRLQRFGSGIELFELGKERLHFFLLRQGNLESTLRFTRQGQDLILEVLSSLLAIGQEGRQEKTTRFWRSQRCQGGARAQQARDESQGY
mmetsp:Transcript_4102/g.8795  ORF Transcript_4102/g.8795 Transcript_4102/m.8795 type:complete len:231 (+) Transcript_4102:165-857(+)